MAVEKLLAGQVAWVTGSSRGLGRVMAIRLCALGTAAVLFFLVDGGNAGLPKLPT